MNDTFSASQSNNSGPGSRIGNYSRADASNYEDSQHPRQPVALKAMLAFLTDNERLPLDQQVVADLPCGSGLYVPFLGAKKLILTDFSQGMLDRAKAALPQPPPEELVHFQSDLTRPLPLEPESVDSITCNQFIHHVATPDEQDRWAGLRRVFSTFHGLLKPGGRLAITFCTRQQVAHSYWTHSIFAEDAIAEEKAYYPEQEDLLALLVEAGFSASSTAFEPITEDLQKDTWNINPMDPRTQSGDSGFRFALKTGERRAKMQKRWQALQADPAALRVVKEAARDYVGTKGGSTLCMSTKLPGPG